MLSGVWLLRQVFILELPSESFCQRPPVKVAIRSELSLFSKRCWIWQKWSVMHGLPVWKTFLSEVLAIAPRRLQQCSEITWLASAPFPRQSTTRMEHSGMIPPITPLNGSKTENLWVCCRHVHLDCKHVQTKCICRMMETSVHSWDIIIEQSARPSVSFPLASFCLEPLLASYWHRDQVVHQVACNEAANSVFGMFFSTSQTAVGFISGTPTTGSDSDSCC